MPKTKYIGYIASEDNEIKQGFGQLKTENGTIIQGEFFQDEINGLAIVQNKEEQFFGYFKNGQKHGIACHDYPSKTLITKYSKGRIDEDFTSELQLPDKVYKLGKINTIDFRLYGYGEIDQEIGNIHIKGFFRKNYLDGFGIVETPEFKKIGDFVKGKLTSIGKIEKPNGDYIISEFIDDQPVGFGIENSGDTFYCGDFNQNREKTGNGLLRKKEQFEYVGELVDDGVFQGNGKLRDWVKNEYFIGKFEKSMKTGIGYLETFNKETNKSEKVYYGNFEHGLPNGIGIEKVGFEERFVGKFVNGIRHGKGFLFNTDTMELEPAYFKKGVKTEKRLNATKIADSIGDFMNKEPTVEKMKISKEVDDIEFVLKGRKEALETSQNIDLDFEFERAHMTIRKKRELLINELKKRIEQYKEKVEKFKKECEEGGVDVDIIELNDFEEDKQRAEESKITQEQDAIDLKLKLPLDLGGYYGDSDDEEFGKLEEEKKVEDEEKVEEKKEEEDDKNVKILDAETDEIKTEVPQLNLEIIKQEEERKRKKPKMSSRKELKAPTNNSYEKVKKIETRKYSNMFPRSKKTTNNTSKGYSTYRSNIRKDSKTKVKSSRRKKKPKNKKTVTVKLYKKIIYDDFEHFSSLYPNDNRISSVSDHPFYSRTSRDSYYKDYGIDSLQRKYNSSLDKLKKTRFAPDDKLLEYEEFFDGPGTSVYYTHSPEGLKRKRVYKFNTDYKEMYQETVLDRISPAKKKEENTVKVTEFEGYFSNKSDDPNGYLGNIKIPEKRKRRNEDLEELGIKNEEIKKIIRDNTAGYVPLKYKEDKLKLVEEEKSSSQKGKIVLKGILKKNREPKKEVHKRRKTKGSRDKEWKRIRDMGAKY